MILHVFSSVGAPFRVLTQHLLGRYRAAVCTRTALVAPCAHDECDVSNPFVIATNCGATNLKQNKHNP